MYVFLYSSYHLLIIHTMSIVSVIRQKKRRSRLILSLSIGSILGGQVGNFFLKLLFKQYSAQKFAFFQNSILIVLVVFVLIYFHFQDKITPLELTGFFYGLFFGFCLGAVSSFLGIGGGPFNIIVYSYFFGLDNKTAAFYSTCTILFSNLSKLISFAFTTNWLSVNLLPVPVLIIGAIGGSLLGSSFLLKFTNKHIQKLLILVLYIVVFFCLINIINSVSVLI